MELAALVAVSLLASAQSSEVLGGLGDNVVVEGEVDATFLGCDRTPSAGAVVSTKAIAKSRKVSATSCRSTMKSEMKVMLLLTGRGCTTTSRSILHGLVGSRVGILDIKPRLDSHSGRCG